MLQPVCLLPYAFATASRCMSDQLALAPNMCSLHLMCWILIGVVPNSLCGHAIEAVGPQTCRSHRPCRHLHGATSQDVCPSGEPWICFALLCRWTPKDSRPGRLFGGKGVSNRYVTGQGNMASFLPLVDYRFIRGDPGARPLPLMVWATTAFNRLKALIIQGMSGNCSFHICRIQNPDIPPTAPPCPQDSGSMLAPPKDHKYICWIFQINKKAILDGSSNAFVD